MRVGILCEFSGTVRDAFIRRGHDAWSCDLLETDASGPHIVGDCLEYDWSGFDLLICHPPCTYLAVSGIHWNKRVAGRAERTEEALKFVRALMDLPVPRIAVENPISIISSRIRKPDQIIQPWQFGHDASKSTCLWLKGLPKLVPTGEIPAMYACACGGPRFDQALGKHGCPKCGGGTHTAKLVWANQTPSGQNKLGPSEDRWKLRSLTYQGIADAMAEQWGNL